MKRSDVEKMLEAGLISPTQRDAIVEHFRLNESKGMRWLLICLSVLAGGLIVAGMVMLVSANWYSIPPLVKMLVAMLLMAGFWFAWAKQREVRPITSEVLGFCGGGMWLACIALYGQIFQLQNPFVEGCTLFFAGIVLLPFVCRQRFLIWAVVLVSFIELIALGGSSTSYLSLVKWIPGFRDVYTVFVALLMGAIWWGVAEKWRVSSERWRSYYWVAPVLLLSCVSVTQMMMYEGIPSKNLDIVICVLMALVPLVLFALKPRGMQWLPWGGVSAIISLALPCWFLVGGLHEHAGLRYNGHYTYQAVENAASLLPAWVARFSGIIIYFLMSLLMMFSGVRARRMSWINIGSLMVVFTAIALVTDVLRSYTFSGLVLVGAGLLLLALGVLLEKSRRRLIRTVCNPQPSTSQS